MRIAVSLAALCLVAPQALAQDASVAVPVAVVYPGEVLRDDMLADAPAEEFGEAALPRRALVGKMARRTLLPGQPVGAGAIDNSRLVRIGAEVKLIFRDGELEIDATGAALQDGALGDVVRVRNTTSGVAVSGAVQADGSVQIGGG